MANITAGLYADAVDWVTRISAGKLAIGSSSTPNVGSETGLTDQVDATNSVAGNSTGADGYVTAFTDALAADLNANEVGGFDSGATLLDRAIMAATGNFLTGDVIAVILNKTYQSGV